MVDLKAARPGAGRDPLVFHRLDSGPGDTLEVARLDEGSGLLTPAQATCRRRPVVIDRKAYADIVGRKSGVDLIVERANGWRSASVPLFELVPGAAVSMQPVLLRQLAASIERFSPRGGADVTSLLLEQARYLQFDGGPVQNSPLSRKIASTFERFERLWL